MYDLLIKGGRVIDPSQNIDDNLDVAIIGDKISLVAKDIPPHESKQVLNVKDKIVSPGLIDIHCHISGGIHPWCIDPDAAGVNQGVTTVVDGGSTGSAIFVGFPRFIIPSSKSRVFCFIHLSSLGLTMMPELKGWYEINQDDTIATIESNREIIKGVKLRLVGNLVAREGIKIVEIAQKIAKQFGMPIMIHIGDSQKQVSPTLTQETLSLMQSGDILSHVFTGQFGSILQPDGTVLPELKEAIGRGVVLDVAVGGPHLSFEVARKCLGQGILPTTLSTDLTIGGLNHIVYGMTVTMSKFMGLGLDLKQVIEMSTINPARALGEEKRLGGLKPGMEADISILELVSGRWNFEDFQQRIIEVDKLLTPVVTVKAGQVIPTQLEGRP